MKQHIIAKILLVIMLYFDLFFLKDKWERDCVFVCRKCPNKYFQPILYKLHGYKKTKVELGLLILETYSHFITIALVIETVIGCLFNMSVFYPIVIFAFWLATGIFVMVYLIINFIKNK